MNYIIYDATTKMIVAVFGSALQSEANSKLKELQNKAVGTNSKFRLGKSEDKFICCGEVYQ